jgi:5'-deoxynucleotidase YfbR-like HD superfamily hydrolase
MNHNHKKTFEQKLSNPRAWQRMLSGRRLDIIDPHAIDIEIEDIALGLSRVARWNGQTLGDHAFSVAQHSLLVESICGHLAPSLSAKDRLTALLHDAPEYVIGDMISPFKTVLGDGYKAFETHLEQAIFLSFGLSATPSAALKALIKRGDHCSAYFEATQLAGFTHIEAEKLFGTKPKSFDVTLVSKPSTIAKNEFMHRFMTLLDSTKS